MPVQSILIPNEMGKVEARKWLKAHGYAVTFHGKHVHQTKNYLRYRQMEPKDKEEVRTRTITLDKEKGIKAITQYPKK